MDLFIQSNQRRVENFKLISAKLKQQAMQSEDLPKQGEHISDKNLPSKNVSFNAKKLEPPVKA
jgi:hypothetical protein